MSYPDPNALSSTPDAEEFYQEGLRLVGLLEGYLERTNYPADYPLSVYARGLRIVVEGLGAAQMERQARLSRIALVHLALKEVLPPAEAQGIKDALESDMRAREVLDAVVGVLADWRFKILSGEG